LAATAGRARGAGSLRLRRRYGRPAGEHALRAEAARDCSWLQAL